MFYQLNEKPVSIALEEINDANLCVGTLKIEEMEQVLPFFDFADITITELKQHSQHTVNKLDAYFGYCFGIVYEVYQY